MQSNGEIRNGEPFAIFLFHYLDLVVSQIGNEMKDGNVRLSMKRKGQYSAIAFSVNITQIFILSYLTAL